MKYFIVTILMCSWAHAQYCVPTISSNSSAWMTGVQVGGINNTSGNTGYTNYPESQFTTTFETNQFYEITMTPSLAGARKYYSVFIDYNQNGTFDLDEKASWWEHSTLSATSNINIPAEALAGKTRMRVFMKYVVNGATGEAGTPTACETVTNGEVEDYTITISESQNPLLVHKPIFTSGTENTHTFRIPAMVTAPNGDIIVAVDARRNSAGDLMYARDIDIVIKRSQDNGVTWSPMETVLNLPDGEPVSDPSMLVDDSTGTIFIFYNYMNRDTADGEYRFFVQHSTDNGVTWSEYTDFTDQVSKPAWQNHFKFITSGRGIQTRNGTLLHTMVNLTAGLHVFGSDDHGQTWFFKDVAVTPANESKIIELDNGDLMINSRSNGAGRRYVHRSTDIGASWSGAYNEDLIDPGCNASIIRYTSTLDGASKSRLLFSNAKSSSGRTNMTVRISYDEGLTWSEGKTINTGSSAYSDLTILNDGTIGLVYEAANYQYIQFARFSLEWLTDGQDSLPEIITPIKKQTELYQSHDFSIEQRNHQIHLFGLLGEMKIKILDINGKLLHIAEKNMHLKDQHLIDVKDWPNGIYFITLSINKRQLVKTVAISQ